MQIEKKIVLVSGAIKMRSLDTVKTATKNLHFPKLA